MSPETHAPRTGATARSPADAPGGRRARTAAAHLLYDLALVALLVGGSPYFLYKAARERRFRAGLAQRFGFVPRRRGRDRCLWIHGVSVGEVKAALPLVRLLAERRPEYEVALSSTTDTGHELLAGLFPERFRFFYPLDLPFVPARVMDRVAPRGIVLMELEIWPNFLRAAGRRGVPVAVVNGRISERSWRGYRRARRLLPQLDRIALYCVQNRRYAERFLDLGVPSSRVVVTGNMKFDAASPRDAAPDAELGSLLRLAPGESVIVGGSTHAGEEAALWRAVRDARASLRAPVRLLVAPRHPDRAAEVASAIEAEGGRTVSLTALRRSGGAPDATDAVVVDTIGELERVYTLASAVFVGGSLAPRGGQNVLEPAALGKPSIVGPHTFNFEDEVNLLVEGGGARRVDDEAGLGAVVRELLADGARARECGARAHALLQAQRGATARTLDALERAFLAPDAAFAPARPPG